MRAALIGLGGIAWKYDAHTPDAAYALSQAGAMLRRPDLALCGGCSPDAEDRQGFASWSGGLPTFLSPEDMLRALQPDLVGVCSPTPLHEAHALCCLNHGVRCLWLEKPPAHTAAGLGTLIERTHAVQATVCVNYFRRYLPLHQRAKALAQGKYAPCHGFQILYSQGLERNAVHLLDQVFYLTEATDFTLLWADASASEENPHFALRLSTGQEVLATGMDLPYHTNNLHILCAGGIICIDNASLEVTVRPRTPNALFPGFHHTRPQFPSPIGEADVSGYMDTALDDLLRAFATGQPPQSSLETALLSQQALEAIRQRV